MSIQSRITLPMAEDFLEYHGNWFVFLFEMRIHVKFLKVLHPKTPPHHTCFSNFQGNLYHVSNNIEQAAIKDIDI